LDDGSTGACKNKERKKKKMLYSRYPLDQSLSLFRLQQKILPNSAIEVVLSIFLLPSEQGRG
jgi:hypothetical protein